MADQAQITELSGQLQVAFEQVRACERQIQLCENQKRKAELVMGEVEKNDPARGLYRSMGRMFVLCSKDELKEDLTNDLNRIAEDSKKSVDMKVVLDAKKETLTKQLNDLDPTAATAKKEWSCPDS